MDFFDFLGMADVHFTFFEDQTEVGEQVMPDNQSYTASKN